MATVSLYVFHDLVHTHTASLGIHSGVIFTRAGQYDGKMHHDISVSYQLILIISDFFF